MLEYATFLLSTFDKLSLFIHLYAMLELLASLGKFRYMLVITFLNAYLSDTTMYIVPFSFTRKNKRERERDSDT